MKVDLKRESAHYTAPRGRFEIVTVPAQNFIAVDGCGDPNTAPEYRDAIAALYPVAYRLKFLSKARGQDYTVMPLEALWWAEDLAAFTTARDASRWQWTAMILVPEWLTLEDVAEATAAIAAKAAPTALPRVQFRRIDEGLCAQTLHVGPYSAEGPVLAELHERVLPSLGLAPTGHHHEIYLGDPRRAAPERLRTILRQPVRVTRA